MALKRDYQSGSKYLYAKITNINFSKDNHVIMAVTVLEKQDALEQQLDPETMEIIVPAQEASSKEINVLSYSTTGSDANFSSYFSIDKLDEIGVNLYKQCYLWIKENIDLFRDFQDC